MPMMSAGGWLLFTVYLRQVQHRWHEPTSNRGAPEICDVFKNQQCSKTITSQTVLHFLLSTRKTWKTKFPQEKHGKQKTWKKKRYGQKNRETNYEKKLWKKNIYIYISTRMVGSFSSVSRRHQTIRPKSSATIRPGSIQATSLPKLNLLE